MSLLWTLSVPVAAIAFMTGALSLGSTIVQWTGSQVAKALFLPVTIVLGAVAWMLVLAAAWRLRRIYLRRVGTEVPAVVVESDLQCRNNKGLLNLDLWRVRVVAQFPHPDTGIEAHLEKQYFYQQFREGQARSLADQLRVGAKVPVVVRKNAAMFDVPKRPVWADIW